MTGWIILAVYVIGYLYTARRIAIGNLESTARHNASLTYTYTPDKPLVDGEDRVLAMVIGAVTAFAWPVALPIIWVAKGLRAPTEIARERDIELKALRELARKHGLPMPDTDKRD